MSDTLLTALISASAAVIVAALSFAFNRRLQFEAAWRSEKLTYYKEFIDALAMIVGDSVPHSAQQELSRASNNLLLVAPSSVLAAHHAYREQIGYSNDTRNFNLDSVLLAGLVNAIRSDLAIKGLDSLSADDARLWRTQKSLEP